MKDAINYFIPILKDPMNDITGRCMTNNAPDSAYCGSYHPTAPAKALNQPVFANHAHYPDVQMETNSMDIQYNNLIGIDDYHEQQAGALHYQPRFQPASRKRNNYDCDIDSIANAKRCRREDTDPSHFPPSEQLAMAIPLAKIQTYQRQPTHNMPDVSRCMMGHYV